MACSVQSEETTASKCSKRFTTRTPWQPPKLAHKLAKTGFQKCIYPSPSPSCWLENSQTCSKHTQIHGQNNAITARMPGKTSQTARENAERCQITDVYNATISHVTTRKGHHGAVSDGYILTGGSATRNNRKGIRFGIGREGISSVVDKRGVKIWFSLAEVLEEAEKEWQKVTERCRGRAPTSYFAGALLTPLGILQTRTPIPAACIRKIETTSQDFRRRRKRICQARSRRTGSNRPID